MSADNQPTIANSPDGVDIEPKQSESSLVASSVKSDTSSEQNSNLATASTKEELLSTNNENKDTETKDKQTDDSDSSPGSVSQQNPEPAKRASMTLSVANLMSDPTPLNTNRNKVPPVTIKTATSTFPQQVIKKVTIRAAPVPQIPVTIITNKQATDFKSIPSQPISVIQTHSNRQIPFNPLNQNFASQSQYSQFAQQYFAPQQAQYGQKYAQQYQQSYQLAQYQARLQGGYQQLAGAYPQQLVVMPMQTQDTKITIPQSASYITNTPKAQAVAQSQQKAHQTGKHSHEMQPSEPKFYPDEDGGQYGVRCTCGDNHNNGQIVQCEKCQYWLHMVCVNVPRASSQDHFFCPFCLNRKLRCHCKKNKSYDYPIIQCSKCGMWVHKGCEGLGFGIVPKPFVCGQCDKSPYKLPKVTFSSQEKELRDFNIYVEPNRYEVFNTIPDGPFKRMLEADLSNSELSFFDTISKYFNKFPQKFFNNKSAEFWKVFVSTFSQIFRCEPSVICNAIDRLSYILLYAEQYTSFPDKVEDFNHSEIITNYVNTEKVQEFDTMPPQTQLSLDMNGRVVISAPKNDGDYICDLPGFLMHTDEVPADNGIPPICFAIDGTDLIIDMSGSSFTFAPNIRRSFHPNASVRMIRVAGKPRVALFAEKQYGPLIDDKAKHQQHCLAIPAGGEIILPLDGDIPFPIEDTPWKDKKSRARGATRAKEEKTTRKKKSTNKKSGANQSRHSEITLLSGFLLDEVPPLPFTIISDEEMDERKRIQEKAKERRNGKSHNDDFVFD